MPGTDKTGPFGTGPIGSGMGPCGGIAVSQRGNGRGMGRGFQHGGFGWRSTFFISADEEKTILEERKNWLKTQIIAVDNLLENLKKPEE